MQVPCFDFLRTKRQLGYDVHCAMTEKAGVGGVTITVRSQRDKFTVEEVKSNISEFLIEFENHLNGLTADQFEGILFCRCFLTQIVVHTKNSIRYKIFDQSFNV